MINLLVHYSGHVFTKLERFFTWIGAALLLISTATALLSYGLIPLLSETSWRPTSSGTLALATAFGILFIYLGTKAALKLIISKVNASFSTFLLYRLFLWLASKVISVISFVVIVIFFSWIRQSPPSNDRSYADQQDRDADDIWDNHPKHYYDQEPPKPFS